jgi:general secretion pathway protein D
MDQLPEQVMIETLVVEASLDKTDKLGVEWMQNGGTLFGGSNTSVKGGTSFGLQADPSQPQGLRYTINAGQYSAFVQALHSDKRFNVLSTPRIFTTNNAPAQINISQSLPYVTSQTVDSNGSTLVNYSYLDVGIVLTVTPRITSNGYVTMDVSQTANDFVGYTSFNAPIVNQREAQTTASVKDGETIVLGGIINNTLTSTKNKVPLLGDLPVLGSLFRSNNTVNSKTELLVFMTPHVVRDPDEARALREKTEAQLGRTTQQMIPQSASVQAPAPKPASVAASPTTPVVITNATVTVTTPSPSPTAPVQSTTVTLPPSSVTVSPAPSDVQLPPPTPVTPPSPPTVPTP